MHPHHSNSSKKDVYHEQNPSFHIILMLVYWLFLFQVQPVIKKKYNLLIINIFLIKSNIQ